MAIAGLIGTFIASAVSNTRTLYRLEPLPGKAAPPARAQQVRNTEALGLP